MRRRPNSQRSWPRAVSIVLLMMTAVCSSGCDLPHVFGSNWTINVWIPLGLDGNPGLLNPSGGTGFLETPAANVGVDNSPPVGELVGSPSDAAI